MSLPAAEEDAERLLRHYAHCIAAQPEPECPNTKGWWAVSEATGLAIPRACKRWTCDNCRRIKRRAVLVALQHGVSKAKSEGRKVRHLVLTDRDGSLDFASFYHGFTKKLAPRLRRVAVLAEYAVALEAQPQSGRLHGHVLLVEPAGRDGYIPKRLLDRMTHECGFGWTFISLVRDIPPVSASLVEYFVKGPGGDYSVPSTAVGEIGTYMSKAHEMARLSGFTAKRLRPFRVSGDWPLGIRAAGDQLRREMYGEADNGPWVMVRESKCSRWLTPLREHQSIERDRARAWREASVLDWAVGRKDS